VGARNLAPTSKRQRGQAAVEGSDARISIFADLSNALPLEQSRHASQANNVCCFVQPCLSTSSSPYKILPASYINRRNVQA
jgi:hypothetical protein